MNAVNLLPPEYAPKRRYLKLSKVLRKISIIGYLVYFVLTGVFAASLLVVNKRVQESKDKIDKLSLSIEALKETEQKLVLIQDRLSNIKKIKDLPSIENQIDKTQKILDELLPIGVVVKNLLIKENSLDFVILVDDSDNFSESLDILKSLSFLRKIKLESFKYNPETGYEVHLTAIFNT